MLQHHPHINDYKSMFYISDTPNKIYWYDFCHRVKSYPAKNIKNNKPYKNSNFEKIYDIPYAQNNIDAIITTTKVIVKCATPDANIISVTLNDRQFTLTKNKKDKYKHHIRDILFKVLTQLVAKFKNVDVFICVDHLSTVNKFGNNINIHIFINFKRWTSWNYVKTDTYNHDLLSHSGIEFRDDNKKLIDFTHVQGIKAYNVRSIKHLWFLEYMKHIHTLYVNGSYINSRKDIFNNNKTIVNFQYESNPFTKSPKILQYNNKFIMLSYKLNKTLLNYLEELSYDPNDQLQYLHVYEDNSSLGTEMIKQLFNQILKLQNIKYVSISIELDNNVFLELIPKLESHPTLISIICDNTLIKFNISRKQLIDLL